MEKLITHIPKFCELALGVVTGFCAGYVATYYLMRFVGL